VIAKIARSPSSFLNGAESPFDVRTTLPHIFPMSIQLNGKPHPLTSSITLSGLLDSLGLGGKPVVAELNGQPVLPRKFPTTAIQPGDNLEIITLAAGG
jgi:sulfur carrier protein